MCSGCGLSCIVLCVFFQEAAKKHHHLDVNTLRGHTDCVTALDFSSDACNLATGEPTPSLPFDQNQSCFARKTFNFPLYEAIYLSAETVRASFICLADTAHLSDKLKGLHLGTPHPVC